MFCRVANAVICCTQLLFSRSARLMEFFGSFDLKPFCFSDQHISGRGNQIVPRVTFCLARFTSLNACFHEGLSSSSFRSCGDKSQQEAAPSPIPTLCWATDSDRPSPALFREPTLWLGKGCTRADPRELFSVCPKPHLKVVFSTPSV